MESAVTPIERASNLGPITGAELRSLGIDTLEQLEHVGWPDAFVRWVEAYPERLHLLAAQVLAGAVTRQDWRWLDASERTRARALVDALRRERGGASPARRSRAARAAR